ncbi:hypothetical protein BsWGS_01068 [Bradybaena similaris]
MKVLRKVSYSGLLKGLTKSLFELHLLARLSKYAAWVVQHQYLSTQPAPGCLHPVAQLLQRLEFQEVMNQNVIKKIRVSCMVTLTMWIIAICFWSLGLQLLTTWRMRRNRGHASFNSSLSYTTRMALASEQPISTFVDFLQLQNVAQIKRDLNYSTLTSEAVMPAYRIGNYIFLNANLCKDVQHIDFIIIVHTAPQHFERRRRIRASFANPSLFYPIQIRVAFLLGKTHNTTLTRMLWLEHETYNDTVMGDFIDDYHNLTIKCVMGVRWLKDHCPNADFVLKIDDDVVINMFRLIYWFLPQMKEKKRSIFCNVFTIGEMAVLRQGKWKVDSHIFPSFKAYPYKYCSGFTVIMTPDLVDPLYQAAKVTPFFWIDDVYLFGMLPFVVGNVSYHHHPLSKNMTMSYSTALNCLLTQGMRCPVYSTIIPDAQFWTYWKMLTDMYMPTNGTMYAEIVIR